MVLSFLLLGKRDFYIQWREAIIIPLTLQNYHLMMLVKKTISLTVGFLWGEKSEKKKKNWRKKGKEEQLKEVDKS